MLCTFASNISLTAILAQKDDQGNKLPISFLSFNLQGPKLNYPTIDKQAYAFYKDLKHFRTYLMNNHYRASILDNIINFHFFNGDQ